ncbi:helix-turn-helix domain-containing protein [Pelagibacterium montanilacus]|uniref:helix-turn-helix domain-containing protein n=1 Tax=Pelagibacterium montanilacus TaxID=2185280 RepID=UPI001FE5D779|nr:helix-turn-helix domain-containing protein [Pelagibacterium montanilacus]
MMTSNQPAGRPYAHTALVRYLDRRILELKPRKSQAEIGTETGFIQPNMVAMIKRGSTRLPLDRVAALAQALECDPAYLLLLALDQHGMRGAAYDEIFGRIVTRNEMTWISELRVLSGQSDPRLTSKGRAALRSAFGL